MAIKVVGNTVTLSTTPVEASISRYFQVKNSNTTVVANVSIGANDSVVDVFVSVLPGESIKLDVGYIGGSAQAFLSLAANTDIVFATPIAGGA